MRPASVAARTWPSPADAAATTALEANVILVRQGLVLESRRPSRAEAVCDDHRLRNEAAGAGGNRRLQDVAGSLVAEAVGRLEVLDAAGARAGKRGEDAHDSLRPRLAHDASDARSVERVGNHCLGPQPFQRGSSRVAAAHPDDLVAADEELPHDLGADRPGRPGDEDPHPGLSSLQARRASSAASSAPRVMSAKSTGPADTGCAVPMSTRWLTACSVNCTARITSTGTRQRSRRTAMSVATPSASPKVALSRM